MPASNAHIPHLPILRKGKPYQSLDVAKAVHYRTKETIAEVSQANLGLIRRDLLDQAGPRAALGKLAYAELVAMSKRAAEFFLHDTLPLDPFAGVSQSPEDYVAQLSATTGMPNVLVRRNMQKVHGVLAQVDEVLGGLTRGLDLTLLDTGIGMVAGRAISFFPRGDTMGVVLPNNSPGVPRSGARPRSDIPLDAQAGQRSRVRSTLIQGGAVADVRRRRSIISERSRRRQRVCRAPARNWWSAKSRTPSDGARKRPASRLHGPFQR